jgi:hypothetical protein
MKSPSPKAGAIFALVLPATGFVNIINSHHDIAM